MEAKSPPGKSHCIKDSYFEDILLIQVQLCNFNIAAMRKFASFSPLIPVPFGDFQESSSLFILWHYPSPLVMWCPNLTNLNFDWIFFSLKLHMSEPDSKPLQILSPLVTILPITQAQIESLLTSLSICLYLLPLLIFTKTTFKISLTTFPSLPPPLPFSMSLPCLYFCDGFI